MLLLVVCMAYSTTLNLAAGSELWGGVYQKTVRNH
jgi:hypothetical protein